MNWVGFIIYKDTLLLDKPYKEDQQLDSNLLQKQNITQKHDAGYNCI